MNIFRKYWNWISRFRYRQGYGVHSPTDFYLITFVIYEDLPYYAYRELKKSPFNSSLPHYREKVNRLLFRLINHFQPRTLVEVGEGNKASFCYMKAARTSMESYSFSGTDEKETPDTWENCFRKLGTIDMLHIAHTPYYRDVFETACRYVNENTCMVVGNIYENKEKQAWWKTIQDDERVRLTFDLYDIGIVLFDPKRIKQNYIVNFL